MQSEVFGTTPSGEQVRRWCLSTDRARTWVLDFGATLQGVEVPNARGSYADVLLGYDTLEGYLDDPSCFGATIGPVANRTDRAEVPLGGTVWRLSANDGPDGRNNLHSDLDHGLHKRVWSVVSQEGSSGLTLACELSDGELGLPGNRRFEAAFSLADEGNATTLAVRYLCETDAPTYVNMTNHAYFNLAGHGSGDVLGQLVRIEADEYLPLREDSVSAGEVLPVAGTPFDFREGRRLGARIHEDDEQLRRGHGYDHCLCVRGFEEAAAPRAALWAQDPASGRTLSVAITTPGAHLYTGNWIDDPVAKDGCAYHARAGFAFEPEYYPDCIHHPGWPQPVCTPERPFSSTIRWTFGARDADGATSLR
ncbi:aldose epimerase family protein [Olsenella massiliensis]|uniref:aldose epimerase family protein n=1 Tax=Olsenella massiliensis TaxID=1622075 RepID=UPI00071CB99B|nr:aldose epimerase family protein [Olsenella massiliensis]